MVLEEINGEISQQENGIPFRFVKVPLPFVFAIIFLPPVSSFFFLLRLLSSQLRPFVNAVPIDVVVTTAMVTAPIFTIAVATAALISPAYFPQH